MADEIGQGIRSRRRHVLCTHQVTSKSEYKYAHYSLRKVRSFKNVNHIKNILLLLSRFLRYKWKEKSSEMFDLKHIREKSSTISNFLYIILNLKLILKI